MMPQRSHETIVSNQFGPRAESYLTSAVHAQGEDLAQLERLVGRRPDACALDLGCGAGHCAFRLAPLVRQVTAYDLSPAMIDIVRDEAARRGLDSVRTRCGSVENLPFADASFDLVVSRYSAHHWHDAAAGLREARRVLKPGGLGIFIDVVAPDSPLLDTWLQSLELLRDPSHVRNYSVAQWQTILANGGFRPGAVHSYRLRLEFVSWIERMKTPEIQVRAIRALHEHAGSAVTSYFEVETDGSFTLDAALLCASA